ncbi:hypothetical protein [Wenxinia saemankumensis]|uniref:Uncharacterized protein n=1 Tax=Wenxinia saemankumensis TaxID=1447782 RepID=A0A1M6AQV9_9RHOB|nr:hypothetical protein [Wenxinia saemankumensis]SHI38777.1 hypothetical protein SAMN05444417_0569 [Wenxinia saemankumensis]
MRILTALCLILAPLAAPGQGIPEGWSLGAIGYEDRMNRLQARPDFPGAPKIARFLWTGEGDAPNPRTFPFYAACRELAAFHERLGETLFDLRISAGVSSGGVITLSRSVTREFEVVDGRCLSDAGTEL